MKLESITLNKLTLDPNNARKHSERNIEVIVNSLKEFGQRKPIVIDKNNIVIAGNGTLEAARILNWKEIYVVRAPEDWNEQQVIAYALADNKTAELAEWDMSILAEQLTEIGDYFDIQTFGFNPLTQETETAPDDFKDFSEELKTAYQCPKCSYEWNGAPR